MFVKPELPDLTLRGGIIGLTSSIAASCRLPTGSPVVGSRSIPGTARSGRRNAIRHLWNSKPAKIEPKLRVMDSKDG